MEPSSRFAVGGGADLLDLTNIRKQMEFGPSQGRSWWCFAPIDLQSIHIPADLIRGR
jgi:hypothetical protein